MKDFKIIVITIAGEQHEYYHDIADFADDIARLLATSPTVSSTELWDCRPQGEPWPLKKY